jgi:hypothetical protein
MKSVFFLKRSRRLSAGCSPAMSPFEGLVNIMGSLVVGVLWFRLPARYDSLTKRRIAFVPTWKVLMRSLPM